MDILIKAEEILSATKYKSGKACIWVGGFEGATEIPEHGDLIDRDKLYKDTERIGEYCHDPSFVELCNALCDAEVIVEATK